MDLRNPHRYRTRLRINRFKNFVWAILVKGILLVLILAIVYFCIPWMRALWETVRMQ